MSMIEAGFTIRTLGGVGDPRLWHVREPHPLSALLTVKVAVPDSANREWVAALARTDVERLGLKPGEIREAASS